MNSAQTPGTGTTVDAARLRQGQILAIVLMFAGYSGYYLCRSNLSVATPLIIEDLKSQGVTKTMIGSIVSIATLCYGFGKFANGSLADKFGGRKMYLGGMFGAVFATLLFAFGGLPVFTIAWSLNRVVQSAGWPGIVKVSSRWFKYSSYGAVMALLSLSFLIGDFVSRLFLGQLIKSGMGWKGLFATSAGVLFVLFVVNVLFLKESPKDIGLEEPEANPANLLDTEKGPAESSWNTLLLPLFRSPSFWMVCALSLGFTLLRETFNNWIPTYLVESVKMQKGPAGQASSVFPLMGGISVMIAGVISDKLHRNGRAILIFGGLAAATPMLFFLGSTTLTSSVTALAVLGMIAFVLLGPYSFLAGAISLDFGGKSGSATVCGWVDGVGYLGGFYAGKGIGSIAEKSGWLVAFQTLGTISAVTCAFAALFVWQQANILKCKDLVKEYHGSNEST